MKKVVFLITALALNFIIPQGVFADSELSEAKALAKQIAQDKALAQAAQGGSAALCGIEFLSGFGKANNIRHVDDLREIPFLVDFDFNLKPLLNKINFKLPVMAQFQIEPSISEIYEPNKNVEAALAFWFKFGLLPETFKIQPYGKFGVGIDYMTQHTLNQSTQFNFISQLCFGIHYFFLKNAAFTVEGRYRHLSNAGTGGPNRGINSYFILSGLAYRY